MSITVTATELHDRTAELTERAMRNPERPIIVEKRGKPAVMLVDARYFEGLLETLDILSDPDTLAAIRRGLADADAGRLIDHADVLKELGLHDAAAANSPPLDRRSARQPPRRRQSNRPAKARA